MGHGEFFAVRKTTRKQDAPTTNDFIFPTPYSQLSTSNSLLTPNSYRFATLPNKNKPIPNPKKLGNQAPIKGEKTPACANPPLIKLNK